MPATFELDDLDPVDRPDLQYQGISYPAALPDDFGLRTEARARKVLKQIETWENREDTEQKAAKLEELAGEIVQIYFPTLPQEIINKVPLFKKLEIMRWWGENVYPQRMSYLGEMMRLRQGRVAPLGTTISGRS